VSTKPSDYFLTAFEFFGVLLPGAFLTYAILKLSQGTPLETQLRMFDGGTPRWIAFTIASFILGWAIQPPSHFLNWIYDRTYCQWKRRNVDELHQFALSQAKAEIPNIEQTGSVYRWAEVDVVSRDRETAKELGLIQGVSKLFRAITFFLIAAAAIAICRSAWMWGALLFMGAVLCFLVFAERRWCATCLVYQRFKAVRGQKPATAG
jgi:hypothetical protein